MPATPFTQDLLGWYRQQARVLPWRMPPGSALPADPYRVWIAEVMLQQTTVAAASPRYERFLQRFPSVEELAQAPQEALLAEWAGLGYYARARNLHLAAKAIAAEGQFPKTEAGLRALPGLGDYTAAAVAATAFSERTVPVDANILRVGARLNAIAMAPAPARALVRKALLPHVPANHPGDFAQALMDLGSSICTSRSPRCLACPVSTYCAGQKAGSPETFPLMPVRGVKPERRGTIWWIRHAGHIALVRRAEKGLLGGMLGLPGTAWQAESPMDVAPPLAGDSRPIGISISHVFTHFSLTLGVVAHEPATRPAEVDGQPLVWTLADSLETAGLPGLYLKAVRALLAAGH